MLAAVAIQSSSANKLLTESESHAKQIDKEDTPPNGDDDTTMLTMERRESTTSESSLEQFELGRTPKKLKSHTASAAATSTPVVLSSAHPKSKTSCPTSTYSDDANEYEDEESADEKPKPTPKASLAGVASIRTQRHLKRRSSGRTLDKRSAIVQLELNTENPNSLRKKFRFNRNCNNVKTTTQVNSIGGASGRINESGFVDGSISSISQYLNISSTSPTANSQQQQPHSQPHQSPSQSSSSASSSPRAGVCAAVSSTSSSESGGVAEPREDMKYLCPICDAVSATPHDFTNHIRCHNYSSGDTENFTCRICSKVLSSASSLDRHVLVHTGERPFNCKYCHLTFTTNGNMHRHMRTHKQHQHNHHRRRNSNGTKNIKAKSNSLQQQQQQLQLNIEETVKETTALVTQQQQVMAFPLNSSQRVNGSDSGNCNGGIVESYDSDGGISIDSSRSAHSQISDNRSNSNITTNDKPRNLKSKMSLDGESLLKRRVKTTINNNHIIDASDENSCHAHHAEHDNADVDFDDDYNITTIKNSTHIKPAKALKTKERSLLELECNDGDNDGLIPSLLICPVCNLSDFHSMLSLGYHMDQEHSDILAKCRYCDVIFRTHRQLYLHSCHSKPKNVRIQSNPSEINVQIGDSEIDQQDIKIMPPGNNSDGNRSKSSASHFANSIEEQCEFLQQMSPKMAKTPTRSQSLTSLSSMAGTNNNSMMSSRSQEGDSLNGKLESNFYKPGNNVLSKENLRDSKDLADIQSILNMTSSSSASNIFKNLNQSASNALSNSFSLDKDEEEAQDAFTSEFRKMKLRGEFPCKLCSAVFPNLRALKGHNRLHLSATGPSGPFRCNMCPYTNCDKATLIRHMRSHNGDRPYECAVCNYAFTTKANCERHLRNRHAKTTREEVKRSIIYHPSEETSCDEFGRKGHMFSSPDFDDDDLQSAYTVRFITNDRTTAVSHLNDDLTEGQAGTKPAKIQVKRLEQLLDKSNASSMSLEINDLSDLPLQPQDSISVPMDLSMDVLDLSKKPISNKLDNLNTEMQVPELSASVLSHNNTVGDEVGKYEFSKTQPQSSVQDDFNAALKQTFQNFLFNPLWMQNLIEIDPLMRHMYGNMLACMEKVRQQGQNAPLMSVNPLMPQMPPIMVTDEVTTNSLSQMLPKALVGTNNVPSTANSTPNKSHVSLVHSHVAPTLLPGGPVKMVIKNGVLIPKQKQRRYRTERPFACDHCSAKFTLRSNMERHIKQQHPQFYAQRQRNGNHALRGRGAAAAAAATVYSQSMNNFQGLAQAHRNSNSAPEIPPPPPPISEQVKYAILAQQLKARKDSELLQQALTQGSSQNVAASKHQLLLNAAARAGLLPPPLPSTNMEQSDHRMTFSPNHGINLNTSSAEDDEPKLIIDEDDDADAESDDKATMLDDITEDMEQFEHKQEANYESYDKEQIPKPVEEVHIEPQLKNEQTKEQDISAESLLERAIKAGYSNDKDTKNSIDKSSQTIMPRISAIVRDESQDLVPVAKLVDNATNNAVSFNNYFRPSDVANHMEQSDEEGLVASGSASESNNSGTEDVVVSTEPKKKSAYSLAPNRVSCPYCQRMFPWSSSLRRHILTHTGQKPFKCSHCPLLFTTKSNCDRHLQRKHGNVESAMSVYVPTEDVSEPIPVPKSVEEIEQQQRQRQETERRRKAKEQLSQQDEEARQVSVEKQKEMQTKEREEYLMHQLVVASTTPATQSHASNGKNENNNNSSSPTGIYSSSELPYKCHLCESSFGERVRCLDHIKNYHVQEFALLQAKGAIDTEAECNRRVQNHEDEEQRGYEDGKNGGKYPDYSNRKVICAFCVRRFWSAEDLRRHMRTHSGERPFQCEICLRKFTLKHSMLRHMKKHNGLHHNGLTNGGDFSSMGNSGSDFSDDEGNCSNTNEATTAISTTIQDLLNKANEWRANHLGGEHKENVVEEASLNQSDLIGNLLGISDQGILNKLLTSPDEAAKLLGIQQHD